MGFVASFEVFICEFEHSADAFGDVLTGEFKVDTTRIGTIGFVYGEEFLDFAQDVFEVARFVSRSSALSVAVARVAHPDDIVARLAHCLDHAW